MSVRMVLGGAAVRSARTGRAAIKHLLDDDAQHDDDDDDDANDDEANDADDNDDSIQLTFAVFLPAARSYTAAQRTERTRRRRATDTIAIL